MVSNCLACGSHALHCTHDDGITEPSFSLGGLIIFPICITRGHDLTWIIGKQARNLNDEPARRTEGSPAQPTQLQQTNMAPSEPALNHTAAVVQPHEAYSEAPGDAQNRAAQAANAAAHYAEPGQQKMSSKTRRVDEANLAKLVAEENASKSKFPKYPGLERWELLEKMGDGAFSNVYRARDLQGDYGEVGIKVVRKYEMNSMQVS